MFGGGDFASDMVANGAIGRANAAEAELAKAVRVAHEWKKEAEDFEQHLAGNCGVRSALASQLKITDPENPLLNDLALIERIKVAARAGFELSGRNFDGAREVGKTFAIPGRGAKRVQPPQLMANDPEFLRQAYAGATAHRHALMAELNRLDPKNPLLIDRALVRRIRAAGETAFKISGDDFSAAREAGSTFNIPKG